MMTKKEFSAITTGLKTAYPRFTFLTTEEEMEFWYSMLKDIPCEIAENAVMEHISTSIYPPSIAEIRKLCVERCKEPALSAGEAWYAVQNAIRKYGWEYPEKAYETLDPLTLSVVKEMGWSRLCKSEFIAADRTDFRESYEAKAKALQNDYQLPKFVARNKSSLKARYIPLAENSEQKQIGYEKAVGVEEREEITDEQWSDVVRQVGEARRRITNSLEKLRTEAERILEDS